MKEEIKVFIEEAISKDLIVLFMKGSREMPMCGFSAKVVEILNGMNVPYQTSVSYTHLTLPTKA